MVLHWFSEQSLRWVKMQIQYWNFLQIKLIWSWRQPTLNSIWIRTGTAWNWASATATGTSISLYSTHLPPSYLPVALSPAMPVSQSFPWPQCGTIIKQIWHDTPRKSRAWKFVYFLQKADTERKLILKNGISLETRDRNLKNMSTSESMRSESKEMKKGQILAIRDPSSRLGLKPSKTPNLMYSPKKQKWNKINGTSSQ